MNNIQMLSTAVGVSFVLLACSCRGLVFEKLLYNSPMIVVFSSNCYQCNDETTSVLRSMSSELLRPILIVTNCSVGPLRPYVNKKFIAFVIMTNDSTVLPIVKKSMKRLWSSRIVFLIKSHSSLNQVVEWSWAHKMVNVIIMIRQNENISDARIYTYDPFPFLTIREIRNDISFTELFPDKLRDLKGFPVRVIQKYDHPRSYAYTNRKGERIVGGYVAKILYSWVETYNASVYNVDSYHSNTLNRTLVAAYLVMDAAEIALHILGPIDIENMTHTGTILLSKVCIIAPHSPEIPLHLYLFLPFSPTVWYAIIVSIIYISLAESLCIAIVRKKIDIGKAFCNVILGITYQGIDRKGFNLRPLFAVRGQLLFLGFTLTNLFLALLSSFLTATLYGPQIETYEDVDKSGIKIVVEATSFNYLAAAGVIPSKWKHIYLPVSRYNYLKYMKDLNNSYGYSLTSDRIDVIDVEQRVLKRPLFHRTQMCYGESRSGITIRDDSIILDSLNKFIVRSYDVGLYRKWIDDIVPESIEANIMKPIHPIEDTFVPLTEDHMQLTWYCLLFGLAASLTCFALECFISKIMKSITKNL